MGLQRFLPQTELPLALQPEFIGTYHPGIGTLGWKAWCGAGTPYSQDILPNFYHPHMGVGPAHSVSLPLLPVCMDVDSLIP